MPSAGDRREPVCSAARLTARSAALEYDPHEEMTGLDIVELLGVEEFCHYGLGMSKRPIRCRDDPDTTASTRIDGRAWRSLFTIREMKGWTTVAALLYHPRRPCANPAPGVMMNKQPATGVRTKSWLADLTAIAFSFSKHARKRNFPACSLSRERKCCNARCSPSTMRPIHPIEAWIRRSPRSRATIWC